MGMSGVLFNAEISKLFLELSPVATSMTLANTVESVSSNKWIRAAGNTILSGPLAVVAGFQIKNMLDSTAIGSLGATAIILLPIIGAAVQHLAETNGSPALAHRFSQMNRVLTTANKIVFLAISLLAAAIAIPTGPIGLSIFYGTLALFNAGLTTHQFIRAP